LGLHNGRLGVDPNVIDAPARIKEAAFRVD